MNFPEPGESSIESNKSLREGVLAISHALQNQVYAIVGGAACVMLGSNRVTVDIDLVVLRGETKAARTLLKNNPEFFDVDARTLHTFYKGRSPIAVEILSPPALFQEDFDETTPVTFVEGVRVLSPKRLLNAKCGSIVGRATKEKKDQDAEHIGFLLKWLVDNGQSVTSADIPNATNEFREMFSREYGCPETQDMWAAAGFTTH